MGFVAAETGPRAGSARAYPRLGAAGALRTIMRLINLLLNLACALLWINWRSVRLAAAERSSPLSLAAALKKTDSRKAGRWLSLAAILAVLLVRAVFYWNVG